jgi:nucleoside-diphosphate-sugar epimerase
MSKLIFGCGYLGARVAQRCRASGETVHVVTRSAESGAKFAAIGYTPLVADITRPDSLGSLPAAETILFSVGLDGNAGPSIEEVYVQGLKNVLAALAHPPQRFIYISSTGVYGQTEGAEVDEDSPCHPTRPGGRACLAAEEVLRNSSVADRAIILRLAGIYGPGRLPNLVDLQAGKPIAAPRDGYLNLIHVDDAADIVVAVEAFTPPRLYVVSDGQALVRGDYYAELARHIGAPPPLFAPPVPASPAAQRAGSHKRIHPARLFRDLELRLRYPTFAAGLAASFPTDASDASGKQFR